MALPTPECVASEYDLRATFAAIYAALYEYAGNEGKSLAGLPSVDCIEAETDLRYIVASIYAVTYALNT